MSKPAPLVAPAVSFTEEEAEAKIGKTVRLLADHNHLRKGVTGHVVDYHEKSEGVFEVVIRWDSSNGSEPVHDGFSRSKYNQLLSEEEELLTTLQ